MVGVAVMVIGAVERSKSKTIGRPVLVEIA